MIKTLMLFRSGDAGGADPTVVVAYAVVFADGVSVLHWLTEPNSTEVYGSEADMRSVRESSGRSRFLEASAK